MSHKTKLCKCDQYIVFLPTEKGRLMPVDADTVDEEDTEYDSEKHTSHFATCDRPDAFRRKD